MHIVKLTECFIQLTKNDNGLADVKINLAKSLMYYSAKGFKQ